MSSQGGKMKLNNAIIASIDKVIYTLQPRVAYATVIDFTYVSECRDCNNSCQGYCSGTCEGSCADACVDGCSGTCEWCCIDACTDACGGTCSGTCEGSCIDNVQNTLDSKLQ